MDNPKFPLISLKLNGDFDPDTDTIYTFQARQGDKGWAQPFALRGAPNGLMPTQIGFRASKGDKTFIDTMVGFSVVDGVFLCVFPDELWTADGEVICYFYITDGDKIIASTQCFAYEIRPQFEFDIASTSMFKTVQDMELESQNLLNALKVAVSGYLSTHDVGTEVTAQLSGLITDAKQQLTTALNKITEDATVDRTQIDSMVGTFKQTTDSASKLLTSLREQVTAEQSATTDAKNAAETANKAADNSKAQTILAKQATDNANAASDSIAKQQETVDSIKTNADNLAQSLKDLQTAAEKLSAMSKTIDDQTAKQTALGAQIDAQGKTVATQSDQITSIAKGIATNATALAGAQKSFDNLNPATIVRTDGLASDVNLLAGTSDEWQTWTGDALTNSGWLNLTNNRTNGSFLTVVPGTELSYAAEISPSIDGKIGVSFYSEDKAIGKEFFSDLIVAGNSGSVNVTCVVPDGMTEAYFYIVRAATHQTESKQVTWRWRREKLNYGAYPTPYSLPPVTDVGGQFPIKGHINMDAWALKADFLAKADVVEMISGATGDFNTMLAQKEYDVYADKLTNGPSGSNFAVVQGMGSAKSHLVVQIAIDYVGNFYWRSIKEGKTFGSWNQVATKTQIDQLNNDFNQFRAQISGGYNLIDITNSTPDTILNSYGVVATLAGNSLMNDKIQVHPGELIKFHATGYASQIDWRWNEYDQTGNYVSHQLYGSDINYTIPDGIYSLWVSYPSVDDVSMTIINTVENRLAALEAKLNGGTN